MLSLRCCWGCCGVWARLGCSSWCRLYGNVRTEGSEMPRLLVAHVAPLCHNAVTTSGSRVQHHQTVYMCVAALGRSSRSSSQTARRGHRCAVCECETCLSPAQGGRHTFSSTLGLAAGETCAVTGGCVAQSPGTCASRLMLLWGRSMYSGLAGVCGRMLRGASAQR